MEELQREADTKIEKLQPKQERENQKNAIKASVAAIGAAEVHEDAGAQASYGFYEISDRYSQSQS